MSVQIYVDHPNVGTYTVMGFSMSSHPLPQSLLPLLQEYYNCSDRLDRQLIGYNLVPLIVSSIEEEDIELLYIHYYADPYGALLDACYPSGKMINP